MNSIREGYGCQRQSNTQRLQVRKPEFPAERCYYLPRCYMSERKTVSKAFNFFKWLFIYLCIWLWALSAWSDDHCFILKCIDRINFSSPSGIMLNLTCRRYLIYRYTERTLFPICFLYRILKKNVDSKVFNFISAFMPL